MSEAKDHPEQVREEAAQWLARLSSLPVSRDTLERFYQWRRIGDNAEAFDEVESFWSRTETLGRRPGIVAAMDEALARSERRSWLPLGFGGTRAAIALCAMLLLVGAIAGFGWMRWMDVYRTSVGEQRVIQLADGSTVRLNTDTRLKVRFSEQERRITLLDGQAFFIVAHDPSRPFKVVAGNTDVVATGTRFDVRRTDDAVDVTLVDGRVLVTRPDQASTSMTPGQQLLIRPSQEPVLRGTNVGIATAWTNGRIIFDETPLADAVTEVNRYTDRPIRLESDSYHSERFSGSFEVGDTEAFIRAATGLLPLTAVREADGSISLSDSKQAAPG